MSNYIHYNVWDEITYDNDNVGYFIAMNYINYITRDIQTKLVEGK